MISRYAAAAACISLALAVGCTEHKGPAVAPIGDSAIETPPAPVAVASASPAPAPVTRTAPVAFPPPPRAVGGGSNAGRYDGGRGGSPDRVQNFTGSITTGSNAEQVTAYLSWFQQFDSQCRSIADQINNQLSSQVGSPQQFARGIPLQGSLQEQQQALERTHSQMEQFINFAQNFNKATPPSACQPFATAYSRVLDLEKQQVENNGEMLDVIRAMNDSGSSSASLYNDAERQYQINKRSHEAMERAKQLREAAHSQRHDANLLLQTLITQYPDAPHFEID